MSLFDYFLFLNRLFVDTTVQPKHGKSRKRMKRTLVCEIMATKSNTLRKNFERNNNNKKKKKIENNMINNRCRQINN